MSEVEATPRAYLIVNTQFDNAGDALIIRELIRLCSSRAATVVYLGKTPEQFARMLAADHLDSVTLHRQGGYLAACKDMLWARLKGRRCYYFLTPGGLNGEKPLRKLPSEVFRLAVIVTLALAGVHVCQVGISLETIGPRHARLLRLRSRFLHVCEPRDFITLNLANRLGIRTTGVFPDLALNLFSDGNRGPVGSNSAVALSFRVDKDPSAGEHMKQWVRRICESVDGECEIVCVAQVGRDAAFMREVCRQVQAVRPGQARFVDCHGSIDEAVAIYSRCRTVFSNRLHVLLLGLSAGAAPAALAHADRDAKIIGVFEMIGLGHRVFDLGSSNPAVITCGLEPVAFEGSIWAAELSRRLNQILAISN